MNLLDEKYISLISSRLPKFVVKNQRPFTANFRCVLCGDSKKNKSKARGYIMEKKGQYFYYCHNCNHSYKFSSFLKRFDFNLYQQYQKEQVANKYSEQPKTIEYKTNINVVDFSVKSYKDDKRFSALKSIDKLNKHLARTFIEKRNIPKERWTDLFYCPTFKAWTNLWIPNKFDNIENDYKSIIIPILDMKKKLVGYQGRILDHKDIRYISISLTTYGLLIYNREDIQPDKKIYAFEGPFDSMFLPNAVGCCGGAIDKHLSQIIGWDKNNIVIVYDNECRSKEAIRNIENALNAGFNVCIWPESESLKDVNDMINSYVKAGLKLKEAEKTIKRTIDQNTYRGLQGMLALSKWKKRK